MLFRSAAALGLLPLGARYFWVLDLTTNFRLQYLGVAGALLVLLALRRQWPTAAVLFVIGALNAGPVLPYLPHALPVEQAKAATAPFKVMTVNVSYRRFSARRFREVVDGAAPDVLLVIEFTPQAEETLADMDKRYPYALKAPAEGPYGLALWSRFPLEHA